MDEMPLALMLCLWILAAMLVISLILGAAYLFQTVRLHLFDGKIQLEGKKAQFKYQQRVNEAQDIEQEYKMKQAELRLIKQLESGEKIHSSGESATEHARRPKAFWES